MVAFSASISALLGCGQGPGATPPTLRLAIESGACTPTFRIAERELGAPHFVFESTSGERFCVGTYCANRGAIRPPRVDRSCACTRGTLLCSEEQESITIVPLPWPVAGVSTSGWSLCFWPETESAVVCQTGVLDRRRLRRAWRTRWSNAMKRLELAVL